MLSEAYNSSFKLSATNSKRSLLVLQFKKLLAQKPTSISAIYILYGSFKLCNKTTTRNGSFGFSPIYDIL